MQNAITISILKLKNIRIEHAKKSKLRHTKILQISLTHALDMLNSII